MTPRFAAGPPSAPVEVPRAVLAVAAGEPAEPVWLNERGGLTFVLPATARYVKWQPVGSGWTWPRRPSASHGLGRTCPVPAVLASGSDGEGAWLVTAALPGRSAVSTRWAAAPAVGAAGIGTGLRAVHGAPPVLATVRRGGSPYECSAGELAERTMVTTGGMANRSTRSGRTGSSRGARAHRTVEAGSSVSPLAVAR